MHEHREPRERGGLGVVEFEESCGGSMGAAADGAFACMPVQSQYVTDKISRSDSLCNGFGSNSLKLSGGGKGMDVKVVNHDADQEIENGEILEDKLDGDEEIEEGELRISESKELENDDPLLKGDIEAGEIVQDRRLTPETDQMWIKTASGKDDIVRCSSRNKVQEVAKCRPWKGSRDETERNEYKSYRGGKIMRNDFNNNGKEQFGPGWSNDHGLVMTSGEYINEDGLRRRPYGQHCKSSVRFEQAKDSQFSSKIPHDETSSENDPSNDKTCGREFSYAGHSKRHISESDNHDYRRRGESGDSMGTKCRKMDEDISHSGHLDHYSRRFLGRHTNGSSFKVSAERYSSRQYDSSRSSKGFDRHGSSPGPPTWSPHGQPTYRSHHDVSSGHRVRSPCDAWERSPYDRRERSPYDKRERLIYDTRDRSPFDKRENSPYDSRERSHNSWVERHAHDKKEKYQSIRKDSYQEDMKERSSYNRNSRYKKSSLDTMHGPRNCRDHSPRPNLNSDDKNGDLRKGCGDDGQEEVFRNKGSINEHSRSSKGYQDMKMVVQGSSVVEGKVNSRHPEEQLPQKCNSDCNGIAAASGPPEEPLSMEEDMDICDTPPHVSAVADSATGKWVYLDYFGVERGPSKLSELKQLVETGDMWSDHLIKHLDSDRWVTVENAASPLVIVNFAPIASDSVTQLVDPPEAPGNLLVDTGISGLDYDQLIDEKCVLKQSKANPMSSESNEDLYIDERVEALLEGLTVLPGKELEILSEVLQVTFENPPWEEYGISRDWLSPCHHTEEKHDLDSDTLREESLYTAPQESGLFIDGASAELFSWKWSCIGGDWKRDDVSLDDRSQKILVLNDGVSLCQMPKSGYEDPRWQVKDELYYPSSSQMLDLPCWGFSGTEDSSDSLINRSQLNQATVKSIKGALLPVVKINAYVVKNFGPSVAEPQIRSRSRDRYSSKSSRHHTTSKDIRNLSVGVTYSSKTVKEQDLRSDLKSNEPVQHPKDRLCTASDLQLHSGDWYYQDGSGYERGPLTLAELESLVDQGVIHRSSCVFRKFDNLWVPVISALKSYDAHVKAQDDKSANEGKQSGNSSFSVITTLSETNLSSFNSSYPQFIGYTLAKLHELVMKSYKSREFAASINEVLDPWISAKQLKEAEKNIFNPVITKSSAGESNRFHISEGNHGAKRARISLLEDEEENCLHETIAEDDSELSFDELCAGVKFSKEETSYSAVSGTWGLLNGHILARIFHFLRADLKSLAYASLTCKNWRSAVRFYKSISRLVDLSSIAPICNDSTTWQILEGYNRENITCLVLSGCSNVTSSTVEQILSSFPSLSTINVRGCSHLRHLENRFPTVNWSKNWSSWSSKTYSNSKRVQRTIEKTSTTTEDDFDNLKDYFDSVDRRESANQLFRQSLYRRSKVFDARKSSSILPRDARVRRWAIKKSEIDYKKAEKYITSSLKKIMKENTFDFLVPKVEEIEDKIKSGYYVNRGLRSVKEDLSRIYRDVIKRKNRGESGNFNRVIKLFARLATRLDHDSKVMKNIQNEDDSSAGLHHAALKYKKKHTSVDKEYISRSDSMYSINDDLEEYSSTSRDFSRRFLKLNKKSRNSGSDISDDFDQSSELVSSDSESSASETKIGSEFWSETSFGESKGNDHYGEDDTSESAVYEREWGARMTKASLVPPVTRKYEVIDHYVIVADHEEVQRKMQISLPEGYSEKLNAQKSSNEDLDMEIPEVKDFQPRKTLDDEVLEQEVYGIDPYTHNLVLDSMPEELDWSLTEKHLFIEDVVLRTLNKQVRRFTGSGSTPMMYSLKPVIEEIQKAAVEVREMRTIRMCQGILKAMASRPDDKYVAYRKGLGVVCNKDGGFGVDDFIVDFLGEVYPAWRWFEKQDGIRYLQKNSTDPAPEFYNIYLERPKGDADGYDLVVVDAMHKANYASRICHSCRPNCEAKVTAVDGHYQIGIYAVREIQYGEEISFDYNSVTESKEEYEVSVCLCGSQVCRGSYLNLTGEGAFEMVLEECHGILDRHKLMIQACELNSVSEKDYIVLGKAGLGSCLLAGLPNWLIAYTARLVRFINKERIKLPGEILKHNVEEKRKYLTEISIDMEKSDAEIQAEGVYNQRLQNLAVTLDKVRYVMRCVFGDPKRAPPPLEKLSPRSVVSLLWNGERSLVEELLRCMAPYTDEYLHNDLRKRIQAHDPSNSDDVQEELFKSLLWLRDELRSLPCSYKCRHDAAADLIHIYAYTKNFFRIQEYKAFTSPPIYISPLDLGPKYSDKMGPDLLEYQKTYGSNYCLGQLMNWYNQTNAEPNFNLARASRGCLLLPDISSFYANPQKPSRQSINGPRTLQLILSRMEKQTQRAWPEDRVWAVESTPNIVGSPMLDALLDNSSVNKEMMHWLKNRVTVYQAMSD